MSFIHSLYKRGFEEKLNTQREAEINQLERKIKERKLVTETLRNKPAAHIHK